MVDFLSVIGSEKPTRHMVGTVHDAASSSAFILFNRQLVLLQDGQDVIVSFVALISLCVTSFVVAVRCLGLCVTSLVVAVRFLGGMA